MSTWTIARYSVTARTDEDRAATYRRWPSVTGGFEAARAAAVDAILAEQREWIVSPHDLAGTCAVRLAHLAKAAARLTALDLDANGSVELQRDGLAFELRRVG